MKFIHNKLLIVSIIFVCADMSILAQVNTSPYNLFKAGKFRQAIPAANEAIEKNKSNILAYAVLGWSYLNLGRWQDALDIGKKAESINSRDPRIIQIIGEAYFRLGQDKLALQYFSKYLIRLPYGQLRDWVYYYMGIIYERQNKLEKANISISTAISLNDTKVEWLLALGRIYDKQNNKKFALNAYKKVLEKDSDNRIAKQKILTLSE